MPSTNSSFNQYVLASTYMYFKYGSCRGDFNKEEGKIKRKSPHRYFDIDWILNLMNLMNTPNSSSENCSGLCGIAAGCVICLRARIEYLEKDKQRVMQSLLVPKKDKQRVMQSSQGTLEMRSSSSSLVADQKLLAKHLINFICAKSS